MSEVIQYEQLSAFLDKASLFEIYRISAAIKNELENPKRISNVRKKFKEEDMVQYFNEETNNFIAAKVISKNSKYVSIENCYDNERWKIPYYLLKIDSREFDFTHSAKGLSKNAIKVGDFVGFNRDGEEVVGRAERLNQKTVTIVTKNNHKWRVSYSLLYSVIEGDQSKSNVIQYRPRKKVE